MITPSSLYSICDFLARESSIANPLCQRLSYSAQRDINGVAAVCYLVNTVRPLAVVRPIIGFGVNSINRIFPEFWMLGWSSAHVLKKTLERINPSFADLNTFAAIAFIRISFTVVASLFHSLPSRILDRVAFSVSVVGVRFIHNNILRKNMTVLKKRGELIRHQLFGATLATC